MLGKNQRLRAEALAGNRVAVTPNKWRDDCESVDSYIGKPRATAFTLIAAMR